MRQLRETLTRYGRDAGRGFANARSSSTIRSVSNSAGHQISPHSSNRCDRMKRQDYYDRAIAAALASPHGDERARAIDQAWTWLDTPWAHENRSRNGAD